jgi:hypothetical protein
MTFDDGLKKTSALLDELCGKYGVVATLMLCTHAINDETAPFWQDLFKRGNVAPDSHSMWHKYLTNSHPENLTDEIITEEIEGSYEVLKKYFPEHDCLTFGIPYSSYVPKAFEHLFRSAYAVRGGTCVLAYEFCRGKMQTLDPKPGSNEPGGWYMPYGMRIMNEKSHAAKGYEYLTVDNFLAYLDKCVRDRGWFISGTNGIVEGENLDIKAEDLERVLARMQEYINKGELWAPSFSDATKYVRERQNSSVTVTEIGEGEYSVNLTMADMTEDNLPLPASIFNMPLTVRVNLDADWDGITYTQGDKTETVPAFVDCGVKFAYLDIIPNGGEAKVVRA